MLNEQSPHQNEAVSAPIHVWEVSPALGEAVPHSDEYRLIERAPRYTSDASQWLLNLPPELQLAPDVLAKQDWRNQGEDSGALRPTHASHIIARAVMGKEARESLFADGKKPEKAVFERMLQQRLGGEVGMMLTTLLMDCAYPYEKQEGDGYIDLPATSPQSAFTTRKHGAPTPFEASFCEQTEMHFAGKSAYPVEYGGQTVAIEKREGDHTALLTVPAIINGVRIPVGSVLNIRGSEHTGYTFAFGRLTPFCLTDAQDGVRQFPEVFYYYNTGFYKDKAFANGGVPKDYQRALTRFNERTGRTTTPDIYDMINAYREHHGDYSRDPAHVARDLLHELDETLTQPPYERFVRGMHSEAMLALQASEATQHDRDTIKATDHDPGTRHQLIRHAQNLRHMYYQVFGYETVKEAERLIAQRNDLAHYVNRWSA